MSLSLLLAAGAASAFEKTTTFPECVAREVREKFTESLTTPRDVSWYGDSRTTSNCLISMPGNVLAYSTNATTFARKATPANMTIRQRGRNGTSLLQLANGTDTVTPPPGSVYDANDTQSNGGWDNAIRNDASPIIVIAHGTNDSWHEWINKDEALYNADGTVNVSGVAAFEKKLTDMVTLAQRYNKKVVLVEPYRACSYAMLDRKTQVIDDKRLALDNRPFLQHPDAVMAPYAAAVARVAMSRGVHLAPLFSVPVKCHGDYADTDMPDGLHASPAFENVLAEVVKSAINRAVADVRGADGKPVYPKPTLTLLRAPFQRYPDPSGLMPSALEGYPYAKYPNVMPAGGQDYQPIVNYPAVVADTDPKSRPTLQLANWISSHATSVSVACLIEEGFYHRNVAWSNLAPTYVGPPAAMPELGMTWHCNWTATGPGGSTVVPETFVIQAPANEGPTRITVARGPMPLVAGKPFYTTWRADNATYVNRTCNTSDAGIVERLPVSSDSQATLGTKAWNLADVNSVKAIAQAAWVKNTPTSCTWEAVLLDPKGNVIGRDIVGEYFHTVMP